MYSFSADDIIVRVGEYDFSEQSNTRRDFSVEEIFMHDAYERKTYKNDIAVIKLSAREIRSPLAKDIAPICLPPSNLVVEGQNAFVTG